MARTERVAPADEKITINLGPVDLGSVDLLVSEGLYSSRTDLIRAAIRRQLDEHRAVLQDAVTRRAYTIGFVRYDRADLERLRKKKERLRVRVIGAFHLGADVPAVLADEVFERISVLGRLKAPAAVLERLGDKVSHGGRGNE